MHEVRSLIWAEPSTTLNLGLAQDFLIIMRTTGLPGANQEGTSGGNRDDTRGKQGGYQGKPGRLPGGNRGVTRGKQRGYHGKTDGLTGGNSGVTRENRGVTRGKQRGYQGETAGLPGGNRGVTMGK